MVPYIEVLTSNLLVCGGRPDDKKVQSVYVVKNLNDASCYRDGSVQTSTFRRHGHLDSLNRLEVFSVAVQEGGMLPGNRVLVGGGKDSSGVGQVFIQTEDTNPPGRFLPSINNSLKP